MTMTRARRTTVAAGAVLALLTLASCSDDQAPGGEGTSPEEVMELAKTTLDETEGVQITLSTDDLPEGVTGITKAEGTGTHAPAFEGSISVRLVGQEVQVPVVAVDDTVYAQVPLSPGWQEINPADYGAPDPAQLMSTDKGFSSLLPATTDLEQGESVRGGADNDEVLTEYTGTVPDTAVKNVIPSASGDFDATYAITEDGELRTVELTGEFYSGADEMTYAIQFDQYGNGKAITAP